MSTARVPPPSTWSARAHRTLPWDTPYWHPEQPWCHPWARHHPECLRAYRQAGATEWDLSRHRSGRRRAVLSALVLAGIVGFSAYGAWGVPEACLGTWLALVAGTWFHRPDRWGLALIACIDRCGRLDFVQFARDWHEVRQRAWDHDQLSRSLGSAGPPRRSARL